MPIPEELTPAPLTPTAPLLSKALRDLYRSARHIQHTAPYAAARLGRIADQADYFLHQWPDEQWPSVSSSDRPMPSKEVLAAWLATVKQETAPYATSTAAWPYADWRQTTTTLLAALVPFS